METTQIAFRLRQWKGSIGTGTTSRRKTRGTGNLGCEEGKLKIEFICALNGARQERKAAVTELILLQKFFSVADAQSSRRRWPPEDNVKYWSKSMRGCSC